MSRPGALFFLKGCGVNLAWLTAGQLCKRAQAFFTVMEARKACNQGQIEAAIELYESIPLRPGLSQLRRR
jgi:hypothetical protein